MTKFIDPRTITEDCTELEILAIDDGVTRGSTGLILKIRPASHPEVKKLDKKVSAEVMALQNQDADAKAEYISDRTPVLLDERVAAHIEGWRWAEGVPEDLAAVKFTNKQLREFLKMEVFGRYIREQVMQLVAKRANFLKGLAKD